MRMLSLLPAAFLVAASIAVRPHPAWSAPPVGPDLTVIRQGADGFTLEIRVPEPGRGEVLVDGRAYTRLSLPGFLGRSGAGRPDLPVLGIPFAVPRGATVRIQTEILETATFEAAPPLPVPTQHVEPAAEVPVVAVEFRPDPAAYASAALDPGEVAAVGPEQGWRFHRVRTLEVSPVQVEAAVGRYRVARALRVHVRFEGGGRKPGDAAWVPMPADRPEWEHRAERFLINAVTAPLFRERPADGAGVLGAAESAGGVRIRVGGSGLARIAFSDLEAAGLPSGAAPADIRVEERGYNAALSNPFTATAIPRRIEDLNANGVFDGGDRLVVYVMNYADRFQPPPEEERYTYFHTYWVTSTPGGGVDFTARDGFPAGDGFAPVASFPYAVRNEDEVYYLNFPYDPADSFYPPRTSLYWVGPLAADSVFTGTFDAPDPDPAGQTVVKATWQGAFVTGAYATHFVSLSLNGTVLLNRQAFAGTTVLSWTSPTQPTSGLVQAGTNAFRVQGWGSGNAPGSGAYLDFVEVRYDRRLVARGNRLLFHSGSRTGPLEYAVEGFAPEGEILLLDITDPTRPEIVEGVVETAGGTRTLRFRDVVSARRTYYAGIVPSHEGLPASPVTLPPDLADGGVIGAGSGRDLIAAGEGSDYILVTHPRFRAAFEDLARHRESAGHRVLLCDVIEIYDQFAGGNKTPWAIQRFVNLAFRRWDEAPTYLLLGGDANEDYRSDTRNAPPDWVPTMMHRANVPGALGIRELAGTDTWYVSSATPGDFALDFIPDLYVGRLPVGTEEEARAMTEKIVAYEATSAGDDWRARGVFLADDQYSTGLRSTSSYCWKGDEASFSATTREVAESIRTAGALPWFDAQEIHLSALLDTVPELRRNPGPNDCPKADNPQQSMLTITSLYARDHVTPGIIQALSEGCLVWGFTGHANKHQITTEAVLRHRNRSDKDMDRINNLGRPFIFQGYACHLNEFEYSGELESGRSIGELLVLAPGRGAIASLASTGYEWLFTNPSAQLSTTSPLFWDLPRDPESGRPRRFLSETVYFGLVKLAAQAGFGNNDILNMLRTYLVLGDPALRIDITAPRFAATVEGEAVESGHLLTAPNLVDSLLVEVDISDDVDVTTIRVLEGETELGSERVTITPPGPEATGGRTYRAAFKTVVRLDSYDVSVAALDWGGRPSVLTLRVHLAASFFAGTRGLPEGGENLIDSTAVLRAVVEAPVPLEAAAFSLLLDGAPHPADVNPLDDGGRRWELIATGVWAGGPHTLGVAVEAQGQRAEREVAFAVPTDLLRLDKVYFYPNPYETGQGSFSYRLTNRADAAEIAVYTVRGRRVLKAEGPVNPGWNSFAWDGRDEAGDPVANGIYLFVLRVKGGEGSGVRHIERVAVAR